MARKGDRTRILRVFRRYAKLGFDKERIPAHIAYGRMRGVSRTDTEALELLAVFDTLRLLNYETDGAADAVRAIFFNLHLSPLRKNDMTYAVRFYAADHHYDERTVYRQLQRAERMYLHLLALSE